MPDSPAVTDFVARVDDAIAERLRELPDLEQILEGLVADAVAGWPDLELPIEVFLDYLALRVPSANQLDRALRSLRSAELYLCCACLAGDSVALAAFEQRHWGAVRAALARLRIGSLAEEVELQLRKRMFIADEGKPPVLASYGGIGSLDAWLKVVASRVGRRALSVDKRQVSLDDDHLADLMADGRGGMELLRAKPAYRRAFAAAFKMAMAELEPKEINVVKLRFIDGLGLQEMGAIYRVHHTTILRQLRTLQDRLAVRTRELLAAALEISDGDCRSVIRLIQSDFGVTLHSFFFSKKD